MGRKAKAIKTVAASEPPPPSHESSASTPAEGGANGAAADASAAEQQPSKKAKKIKKRAAAVAAAAAAALAAAEGGAAAVAEGDAADADADANAAATPKTKTKKKKGDKAATGNEDDRVATQAAEYLRSWEFHARDAAAAADGAGQKHARGLPPPRWKFRSNVQAWLIRNSFDSARVRDATFQLLLAYAAGIRGRAREFARGVAEEAVRAAAEAGERALHYGPSELAVADAQKARAEALLGALLGDGGGGEPQSGAAPPAPAAMTAAASLPASTFEPAARYLGH